MVADTERPLALPDMSGLSILVVDDNDDSLEIMTTFLKACRARPFAARNADAGLAYVRSGGRFDVIISDLHMPKKDGLDLIRAVRQTHSEKMLPAIAITGYWEQYPEATLAGYNVFLRKPVDIPLLGNTVMRLVGRSTP